MRKLVIYSFLLFSLHLHSQSDTINENAGMKFGLLPAIAFDADLGFQYGGLVNFFWYGDGTKYPTYNHSLYFEASQYTSGTSLLRAYYDSPEFIKGIQTTLDITYFNDLATDFYGFNGYNAQFNSEWIDDEDPNYKSRVFYSHHREMFRIMTNFKGVLTNSNKALEWMAGFTLFNMNINSTNINQLNKRISDDKKLPETNGLYDNYVDWGIIDEKEAKGGLSNYIKLGLSYDTRDFDANPAKGIWSEVFFTMSPSFLSDKNTQYTQLTAMHRQYFTLSADKLIFAYRLAIQNKLSGTIPFYLLPHYVTSNLTSATSQGLGGSKTLRGIRRNRVVGDGFALANIELRWKFLRTRLLGEDLYLANNTFFDMGMITQEYKIDYTLIPESERAEYYIPNEEKMHFTIGTGLKVGYGENFIISADYGLALSKKDGESGLYILLNYLF
ncbi:Omp85 family outer membrane protein [Saccharicrinis aurantiacus]|uniref:Omp85 family outer membrane protein n=1 Tax=Saccharicrinis aurantiacus TaxID=1849719 RepID=UPI002493177D|nr:BamA/TamA family outer membrane protein [Saccharicrinis aurantiacus]